MNELLNIPPEITLRILSYLDIPDLVSISRISPVLETLASDPLMHRTRILVVNPARVNHLLFARGPEGTPFRPTVGDLSRRGVLRGLGIERRWRTGMYFYSQRMVTLYEHAIRLQRLRARDVINSHLRRRSQGSLQTLYSTRVMPDTISSAIYCSIAQALIPVMRKLQWSFQRDELSRKMKATSGLYRIGGIAAWIEDKGPGKIHDGERTRLAVCPSVRKMIRMFEELAD